MSKMTDLISFLFKNKGSFFSIIYIVAKNNIKTNLEKYYFVYQRKR